MSFKVCTYNMGSNIGDYHKLWRYSNPDRAAQSKEEEGAFPQNYKNAEEYVAARLKEQADVFCLQEVMLKNRPLVEALQARNFRIIHQANPRVRDCWRSCVIALNQAVFEKIEDHSTVFEGDDIAIAAAIHKHSGQRIIFVSAHAQGVTLEGSVEPKDAAEGDRYCQYITQKIDQLGPSILRIVGADLNASPEKWPHRFDPFVKGGFEVYRTHVFTNVNPDKPSFKERELDFILSKITPIQRGLFSLWSKQMEVTVKTLPYKPLGWTTDTNASDHCPVLVQVDFA